ncbi:MAG TPA: hypothetical protein VLV15_10630, partial [Dongiaceae bacterium]|nr:hypothetical protein [Dongiaceae bacterium]
MNVALASMGVAQRQLGTRDRRVVEAKHSHRGAGGLLAAADGLAAQRRRHGVERLELDLLAHAVG